MDQNQATLVCPRDEKHISGRPVLPLSGRPLQVLKVCDVDAPIMEAMLMFMYGCLESVPPNAAMPLFAASDR